MLSKIILCLLASSLALTLAFKIEDLEAVAPVDVNLYYESLCPDCRDVIKDELWTTFNKVKDQNLMNLRLIPFGNAKESQKDGKWVFECQHGAEECYGNLLEACIIHVNNYQVDKYLPAIHCIESADDPIQAARGCVTNNHMNFDQIHKCAKGSLGNRIMHKFATETQSLNPRHTYVPWIVIDGDASEKTQAQARDNLLALVCERYTGKKPAVCTGEILKKALKMLHDTLEYVKAGT